MLQIYILKHNNSTLVIRVEDFFPNKLWYNTNIGINLNYSMDFTLHIDRSYRIIHNDFDGGSS